MSDEAKVKWCVSLPPVAQYAKGHMMIFSADSVAELDDHFAAVLAGDTLQKAMEVAALLTGVAVVTDTVTAPPPPHPIQPVPDVVPQQQPAAGSMKTCAHGVRVHRSGEKNGKKWEAWFCPEKNRNAQCDPDWGDR